MKPAIIQLPDIYRGSLYPAIILHWKDRNGDPFNLFGWIPFCSAKDFDFNVRVTDAAHGETRIVLNQDLTGQLKLGIQAWDFIWITGATVYPPVIAGLVTVREPLSDTARSGPDLPDFPDIPDVPDPDESDPDNPEI